MEQCGRPMSPKKIVHLRGSEFLGGPEKQILGHIGLLPALEFTSVVVSYVQDGKPNQMLEQARQMGYPARGVRMNGPLDFAAQLRLQRLLESLAPDLLCAHGYKASIMGWWAARKMGIPIIGFSRGYTSESLRVDFYERFERWVLPRLDGIICVSEGQKRRLWDLGIRNPKMWVVHNAVEVDESGVEDQERLKAEALARLGIPDHMKVMVAAGRLSREKGHRSLVEALALLGDARPEWLLLICGEGPCREDLEKQARRLGVLERCWFLGFRQDIKEIFQAMDLLVLPSLTEGLPNVILEAFACGKPVVATNVGGVPEVVDEGVSGLLVPPGRADLLARAIEILLHDPDRRKKMGLAGCERVRRDFTFEAQAKKLQAIYHQVWAHK